MTRLGDAAYREWRSSVDRRIRSLPKQDAAPMPKRRRRLAIPDYKADALACDLAIRYLRAAKGALKLARSKKFADKIDPLIQTTMEMRSRFLKLDKIAHAANDAEGAKE